MVSPSPGAVVLVRFPFSDLSSSKVRPAVVLAHADGTDWILCQVTSNPYRDRSAVKIARDALAGGSLRIDSYARPKRLFTASESIVVSNVGVLPIDLHRDLVHAVGNVEQRQTFRP